MSFLAPMFLLGGVAIALPLLFHLIRRTSRVRTRFSSLMFLRPAPPRMTRRNRLEDLLLLALRCAVILLLALAFSRPFWRRADLTQTTPAAARRVIALVDVSASMRRSGLWDQASERLRALAGGMGEGDHLAVWVFGRQTRPLFDFADWASVARGDRVGWALSRLAGVSPGWSSTALDGVLIEAADALGASGVETFGERRQVVVISDLQEGSRLDDLQGYEWPEGVEIVLEALKPPETSNAGIQLLAASGEAVQGAGERAQVRVRVENATDAAVEQFRVGWTRVEDPAWLGTEVQVHVPAGQNRVVAIPAPPPESGANVLRLRGDQEPFDNRLFLATTEPRQVRILYLGDETATNSTRPRFFLERAFRDTPLRRLTVMGIDGARDDVAEALRQALLVVATGRLSDGAADALAEWIRRGNTALLAPVDLEAAASHARALGQPDFFREEVVPDEYAMVGAVDFRHPLFEPFADARFSDFTKIHFWRYRRLALELLAEGRVIARFDSGDPLLAEVPLDRGRVWCLASGWHPADSQLAVSSKFVPLLFRVLEVAGGVPAAAASKQVGDVLDLPTGGGGGDLRIVRPDGSTWERSAAGATALVAEEPGLYRLIGADYATPLAVNLDASESRTGPLDADQLAGLGVPLAETDERLEIAERRKAQLAVSELERRQKLWRWFLLGTLTIVLWETWLGGRRARVARKVEA